MHKYIKKLKGKIKGKGSFNTPVETRIKLIDLSQIFK